MDTVKKSGGAIRGKPMNIPGIGEFVMFKDTEGNRVGMLQAIKMQRTTGRNKMENKK
jgi:predicted enzyme related to lactoylglutathione lyase